MIDVNILTKDVNPLSRFYSNFKVTERILLTGHSHQAWPDAAYEGIREAWKDASLLVDDKWEKAFHKSDRVRQGYAELLDGKAHNIALATNTHELFIKFLSALDLKNRRKVITSDSEFYTVRRQLDRLDKEYLEVVNVASEPYDTLAERMAQLVDDKTAAVVISKVFYNNSKIIENLSLLDSTCEKFGARLLIDTYHTLNAIPFSIIEENLPNSFVLGGGYKYCQLGEGNCFMLIPDGVEFRPALTGWFSEFGMITAPKVQGQVNYGPSHWQFAGSTYDPISHYRASSVLDFFRDMQYSPVKLREISLHQLKYLASEFDKAGMPSDIIDRKRDIPLEKFGGFIVFYTKRAARITSELRQRNIFVDFRGENLRFGPAPYLSNRQLADSIVALKEIVTNMGKK
jgi:kynureninase